MRKIWTGFLPQVFLIYKEVGQYTVQCDIITRIEIPHYKTLFHQWDNCNIYCIHGLHIEIIMCRVGLHRKHLVDSYKYPGEMKLNHLVKSSFGTGNYTKNAWWFRQIPRGNETKSPGEIIICHGELHKKRLVISTNAQGKWKRNHLVKLSFATGNYTKKLLVISTDTQGEMKPKSPGEIIICHGEWHRKHLVDSYKYPGEMETRSPGEIIIYHGGKYPGELSVSPPGEVFRYTTVNPPVVKRRKTWGKCPFHHGGFEYFFLC